MTRTGTNAGGWRPLAWRGLWVLVAIVMPGWAQALATVPATPQPRQLTVADGLPSNAVSGFAEDRFGYLWLATNDGLARYDGRGFRTWRIENGLRDNQIWAVHVDARNRLWIGTENAGLVMLDAQRRRFHFYDPRGYPVMLSRSVWAISSTPDGSVWFGTSNGGLYRLRADGAMQRFMPEPGNPHSLPAESVAFLVTAPDGTLWVGTKNGLARWTGHDFERITLPPGASHIINGLSVEPDGSLWIADANGALLRRTDGVLVPNVWPGTTLSVLLRAGDGAYWLDTMDGLGRSAAGRLDNVPLYSVAAHGLVKPNWTGAYQDREGGLWFASANAGLWHLPPKWQQFAVLAHRDEDPHSIVNPYVLAAANSADGRFWVAGTRGLLERLDPATGRLESHPLANDGQRWPAVVLEARDGGVWLARYQSLLRYDPRSGRVQRWNSTMVRDAVPNSEPELLAQDDHGMLWWYSSVDGFQVRDLAGRVLRQIPPGSHGLARSGSINQVRRGPDGRLWLASNAGLLVWNEGSDRFELLPGADRKPVYAFRATEGGVVWLAGLGRLEQYLWRDGQLHLLDSLGSAQGFPVVAPGGMVVDGNGTAWLSSMRGLIRVDIARRSVRVYGVHDGLPSQQLRPRTLLQSVNGQVMVGTPDGLVLFDPEQVGQLSAQPPLMIERVEVRRHDRALELPAAQPLVVEDGDRDLRIVARLVSFTDAESVGYRFRLGGYDNDWVDVGASGERVFSRLPPGHYTLEVQGQTADRVWSKVAALRFRVQPPWWRSPSGIVALVVLLGALVLGAVQLYRRRLRRLQALELAVHKQALAEQASLAKTRFLATLGHEVRTPMTGVLGMSELLLGTALDRRQRNYTEAIRQAGTHLLRLVNDALDLARIEAGRLPLEVQPFAVRQLVEEVRSMTAPLARDRGLEFRVELALPGEVVAQGDITRVRQILLNLLGNAVKFTDHGEVVLRVGMLDGNKGLRLEVHDTGPGIGPEQRARLFQRFEQGEGARTSSRYGGSGLGLAICRELALAMGGHIEVASQLGEGTRFFVELPLRCNVGMPAPAPMAGPASPIPLPSRRVLLVEDDATVAEVIVGLLEAQGHQVVHVPHGLAALTETAEQAFDVALLDLDLPGLDGVALARQLRVAGQSMPLVAVTARSDEQAEPAARAAGFDAFLRKPLTGELLARTLAQVLASPSPDPAGG